jgi:outer membrane receptor for ferrienterochelin and colicin
VQSVTDEELSNVKTAQVEERLAGRFPGVYVVRTPSGGFSIRIRGASTVLGNREPLYVVDGIAVEATPGRGLDWLNPSDIERIDVLKNPAETRCARRERGHRHHYKTKPLTPPKVRRDAAVDAVVGRPQ